MGKSALLGYALETASGLRVARAAGVELEMELAFAGLQQLCAPMLDGLERLPSPQQDALETAFGLSAGAPPDLFFVGLAVLGLLSDVAAEQPLVCLIDDAQWLDLASAQALAFVARRLQAESVALIFATREASQSDKLAGLPELLLEELSDADAEKLLASTIRGSLDERVRDRIISESRGNPLALLELPRASTPADLAGGFGVSGGLPLSSRIEQSFRHRIQRLPAETQRLLLVGAAEPVGDPELLARACTRLGLGVEMAAPAEVEGLLELGPRVRFRHPLVRSAVYQAASAEERRNVHRALAEATDPAVDPDRRAWHRAHATSGPDEEVAADLERSAGRAQARGGIAAAAAFLDKAAALTPKSANRGERALAAAQARLHSGAPDAALGLLATAQLGPLDELQRARVDLLRAQIAFAVNRGRDAPPLLLAAAKQLEPLDATLARDTYLDALSAATVVGRLASGVGMVEVAKAAKAAPPPSRPPRTADVLLDGLALLVTEGYAAGAPTLKRALNAFCSGSVSRQEELRWLWFAGHIALNLWDDETWEVLASRHVQIARDAGLLTLLPIALNTRIGVHMGAGEFAVAGSLLEEVEAITEATGSPLAPYVGLALAALRGREVEVSRLKEATMREAVRRGEGIALNVIQWARAVLFNGLGRYEEAETAVQEASDHPEELWFFTWGSVELIEAAARTGNTKLSARALDRLAETTQATGTELALGMEARARALLSDGEVAETFYREATERLGRTRVRVDHARAHLLFGEWLRRKRRRLEAREQLRTAHELFVTMGAEAFAARAARELVATGETARKRTVETTGELTPQEAHIARLAGDGLSNSEIGARLFISPRTVEYHLHKVFGKLRISSRGQLDGALASRPREAQPA